MKRAAALVIILALGLSMAAIPAQSGYPPVPFYPPVVPDCEVVGHGTCTFIARTYQVKVHVYGTGSILIHQGWYGNGSYIYTSIHCPYPAGSQSCLGLKKFPTTPGLAVRLRVSAGYGNVVRQ